EIDGCVVIIPVFASGVDPAADGLKLKSDGKPKILDVLDCCRWFKTHVRWETQNSRRSRLVHTVRDSDASQFVEPLQVVCGLWASGTGRSGALGSGNTADSYAPCNVMWPPLDEDFQDALEFIGEEARIQDEEPGRLAER
ncbi:hypothetical protein IFM89_036126, partial [Coptis chinensis]